jgi:hypothetical protein
MLERNVATMGTEAIVVTHRCNNGKRDHYWLKIMISDHIAAMTLDTKVHGSSEPRLPMKQPDDVTSREVA